MLILAGRASWFSGLLDVFKDAQPTAGLLGLIALWVGLSGLLISATLIGMYLRDRAFVGEGKNNSLAQPPPRLGPLSVSLGSFLRDPVKQSPFSPDEAAEFVAARLEGQLEANLSVTRFFAYTPLLLGLLGTILALQHLLVGTDGRTLQQIEPLLGGVFAGTFGGILGSLLGSAGVLALDVVGHGVNGRAESYIHREILPLIPERRIAVKIEEAVLERIGARALEVAETFRASLSPVADSLAESAGRSAAAADKAAEAFGVATHAVKEAGNLEAAARSFRSAAHMVDSSADSLRDSTRQTGEVILRVGEVRAGLDALQHNLETLATGLADTSAGLLQQVQNETRRLETAVDALAQHVNALQTQYQGLLVELSRRSDIDTQRLAAVETHAASASATLASLNDVAKEATRALAAAAAAADGGHLATVNAARAVIEGPTRELVAALHDASRSLIEGARKPSNARSDNRVTGSSAEVDGAIQSLARPPSGPTPIQPEPRPPEPIRPEVVDASLAPDQNASRAPTIPSRPRPPKPSSPPAKRPGLLSRLFRRGG